MSSPGTCPRCGKPLEGNAVGGQCADCSPTLGVAGEKSRPPSSSAQIPAADEQTMVISPLTHGPSYGTGDDARTIAIGDCDSPVSVGIGERPGSSIGRYKLVKLLGEGGFGSVWMAEQSVPVRRNVALKVIKLGMDTKEVVGRFEAERQALAMMDHPNIARVFDGGMTDSGRPFFVMELVQGVPVTRYCDERKLPMEERLVLFMHVCYAVQHAHQKGIIHRDIKPANIIVTEADGEPLPKVIDFGIAKALHQPLTDATAFTQAAGWVGTPAYMSPEQAGGGMDVDTRSDIYALGVLLYELLTGRLPFTQEELFKTGIDSAMRIIREQEPPKPSARVVTLSEADRATIASARRAEPAKLGRLLRGELDWIVMKALEKDRTRRYETAGALAMDLQRFIEGEPVSAAAPGWAYQFGKFARRNRAVIGVAAGFVFILITATALSLRQANRATRAEAEARQAKVLADEQRVQAEANFAKARDAVERYLTSVADNPKLKEADFHALRKELLETAVPFYEQFIESKSDDPRLRADQAGALGKLAQVYRTVGDLEKAEAANRRALGIGVLLAREFPSAADYRHDMARNHESLGALLSQRGQTAEAEAEYRRAIEIAEKVCVEAPENPEYRQTLATAHSNLGILLRARGATKEAEEEYGRALTLQERLATRHPEKPEYRQDLAKTHGSLANVLGQRGDLAGAEAAYRRALVILVKLAEEFPTQPAYRVTLANSQNNLANLFSDRGEWEEAEKSYREAVATREKLAADFSTVPEYRSNLANSQHNLANLLAQRGQTSEAEKAYRRAVEVAERLAADFSNVPDYRQDLARSHGSLGNLLVQRGQAAEAEAEYRRALEVQEKLATEFPAVAQYRVNLANSHHSLANALSLRGPSDEAEAAYRRALEVAGRLAGEFPTVPAYRTSLASVLHNLGNLLGRRERSADAGTAYRRALEIQEKLAAEFPAVPEYRQDLAKSHGSLGNLLSQAGEPDKAEAEYRRALELQERLAADFPGVPAYQSVLGSTLNNLAMVLQGEGKWDAACALFERAISHQKKALVADPRNSTYRVFLRAHYTGLSQANIGAGDHAAAAGSALELPKIYGGAWHDCQRAAGLLARCVAVAMDDAALSPEERQATADAYAEQAVALVKKAIANGCDDLGKLKTAREFSFIRQRADFLALFPTTPAQPEDSAPADGAR